MEVTHVGWAQMEAGIPGGMSVLAGLFKMGLLSLSASEFCLFNHLHPSAEISRGPNHGAEGSHVSKHRKAPWTGWRD